MQTVANPTPSLQTFHFSHLVAALRQAAPPAVWNQGVDLARASTPAIERLTKDEIVLRVDSKNRLASHAVVIYPAAGADDEWEWECECPSRFRACEHAVAAGVRLAQANEDDANPLPMASQRGGYVLYAFKTEAPGLALDRYLVLESGERRRLELPLVELVKQRGRATPVSPSAQDLRADKAIGSIRRGALPIDELKTLLKILHGSNHVELDGQSVEVQGDLVLPRAIIDDHPEGFRLGLRRDPSVTDVVCAGVARCGNTLRPIGSPHLGGQSLEKLPLARLYRHQHLAKLVEEVIPGLNKHARVLIKTDRLPKTARRLEPELILDVQRRSDTFEIVASIVYGDPPVARVQGRELHSLNTGILPVRDENAEGQLEHRLRELFDLFLNRRTTLHGPAADAFVAKLLQWQGKVTGYDPRTTNLPEIVPRWLGDEHRIAMDFRLAGPSESSEARADAQSVVEAWRNGHDRVRLLDGNWAALPRDWLALHGSTLAQLVERQGSDSRYDQAQVAAICRELEVAPPLAARDFLPLLAGFDSLPSASLPNDWSLELRDYQRIGVNWLTFLRDHGFGGLLADDMGLGKTAQSLAALKGRSLVVAPTSVVSTWISQARTVRPGLTICDFTGPKRSLDPNATLTITSYALLRLEIDRLRAEPWDAVILDEAQHIKNPDSQSARAAFSLPGTFRLALSGTPVENHLDELWSVLRFSNPGLLPELSQFRKRYADRIAGGDNEAMEQLRHRIRPFVLRRRKQEVAAELPPRSEMVLTCDLDATERQVYQDLLPSMQAEINRANGAPAEVMQILETLLRLRQACCHLGLLPGRQAATSSKTETLCQALQTCIDEGHRALVFSQWTSFLDLLEARLEKEKISTSRLDGATKDRAEVIAKFQDPNGPSVLLLSLKAGGTGLTLTAADHVFIVDPWWNPATEAQAADRVHRIGQEKPVFIYRLVARDTVEERMLELQRAKQQLAENALQGAASATLTRDDLLGLFTTAAPEAEMSATE
jgi:superfamily II DNA or RNA helicase